MTKTHDEIMAEIVAQANLVNAARDKLRNLMDAVPPEMLSTVVPGHVICASGCGCFQADAEDAAEEEQARGRSH